MCKKIPNSNDADFLENIKKNVVLKKKFEFNKNLYEKIDEKKFNDDEFIKISKNKETLYGQFSFPMFLKSLHS